MSKSSRFLFIFLFLISLKLLSQQEYLIDDIELQLRDYRNDVLENRNTVIGYTVGFSMDIGSKRNGSLRAFANIGFLQKVNTGNFHILVGGQSHIEFYRGGLGASLLNSEKFKLNIEIRNSIIGLFGQESNNGPAGKPAFVNVGSDASSLYDPLDYSFSFGTIFINGINHNRHQRIGTLSASANQVMIHYYNDGPPFGFLLLGDTYDRYWTGGGQLGYYRKSNSPFITGAVLRYDNYTGYQLNLYEVGSMLKIDNLPYLIKEEQMFNQARFQYRLNMKNSISFNIAIFEPINTDIQNFIHYHISISPFHTRPLERRWTFGFDYNYDFKFQ